MPKAANGEYEVVLENRQVLGIFIVGVILCGVFFGLGYVVGNNAAGYIAPPVNAATVADGKKSPIGRNGAETAQERAPSPDLTYQQTLDAQTPAPRLRPEAAADRDVAADRPAPASAPVVTPVSASPAAPAAASAPAVSLQVAALSKKGDADALLSVLRNKGFPAVLVTSASDRFYRVQVGPFFDYRDAEETRVRLEREGFKSITKK